MKKSKLFITTLILGIITLFGGLTNNTYADTVKSGLTVSPPAQKIVLIPGEKYTGTIKIASPASSQKDIDYAITIASFSEHGGEGRNDDYGAVDYTTVTEYNQIMNWITLDKKRGTLAPNETQTVTFTIDVPKDAPAGGQYASLAVRDESGSDSSGGGVSVQSVMQILSIIYAEVAGETRNEGVIMENSMPSFLLNSPLVASSRVKNSGNIHTDASWTFQVWPMFSDEEICTNEEKPYTTLIMPESELYHTETCELPSIGIFRAKQTVKIFGEESIIEKTIVICPIWLLFIIIFIVTIIVIWLITRIKSHKGNKD